MPILLIAVSIGLFYLHIDPRYTGIQALMEEKNQYSEALVKARELEQVRDSLLTKYNTLPLQDLIELERLVPDDLNTVKLVADINSVAGEEGIVIESISVLEEAVDQGQEIVLPDSGRPYSITTISFNFTANYDKLVNFVRSLEESLQIIDVKSIDFEVSTDSVAGLNNYKMAIKTYWLKQ